MAELLHRIFVAALSLRRPPPQAEDSFEFKKSDSGFRFAEVEIQPGLPEGFDQTGLKPADSDSSQEFFWLRYGGNSSRAIYLRFDPEAPTELFVDSNRDQKLSATEQHTSDGIWFVELTAEYTTLRRQTSKQRVRIRRDNATSKWHLATAGHRTGKADFGGQLRTAKIEDRNANGLWFDQEDRLSVDFNGDNKLNRLTERIPAQGMSKIRGTLFATLEFAPAKTETMQTNMIYANLIKMVAIKDPEVAEQILDSAFENGAWLYGDPTWSPFSNNILLKAYAWIDPELACQKALELSERYSKEAQVRKLELLTTVISELNTIAIRKGMLRHRK